MALHYYEVKGLSGLSHSDLTTAAVERFGSKRPATVEFFDGNARSSNVGFRDIGWKDNFYGPGPDGKSQVVEKDFRITPLGPLEK